MTNKIKTFSLSKSKIRKAGGRWQGIQWVCNSGRLRTANVQILSGKGGDRTNRRYLVMKESKGNFVTVSLDKVTYHKQDGKIKGKIL